MIPIVTPEEMKAIDAAAPEPVEVLIDRAGAAVAHQAIDMLGGSYGRTVVVIAGPGNNGADGRVAAERLRQKGVRVHVVDATELPSRIPSADLVIDAAFGTGFRGTWQPPQVGTARVLAVDVPTGLDALTGVAVPGTLGAERTVTFNAAKPAHFLGDGPDLVGQLVVADIGLDLDRPGRAATCGVVEASDVSAWLPPRPRSAHKWQRALRLVAGSPGMGGAMWLSAAAAQRAGAGMVVVSTPGGDPPAPIEAVQLPLPANRWSNELLRGVDRFHALLIGPGLGRGVATTTAIREVVAAANVPVVIDGDGLAALAGAGGTGPTWLAERSAPTVLTPHDGEFERLTGERPPPDRVAAARQLAADTGAVVLLKGAATVVAAPGGNCFVVTAGDDRLATTGTGDVLAGIIGAVLASGVDAWRAAAGGAWIHGRAASRCARHGMVASDLVGAIPAVLEELLG